MTKAILLYGRDRKLLESRQRLLRSRGYRVVTASNLAEIPGLQYRLGKDANSAAFHLLIMCHSVPIGECEWVRKLTTSRWPRIKSVVLRDGSSGCSRLHDETFDVSLGPAQLLSMVQTQVQEPR